MKGITMWCPSSLAKLANITPMSLWLTGDIFKKLMGIKPIYNWGRAPPCIHDDTCHKWGYDYTSDWSRAIVVKEFKTLISSKMGNFEYMTIGI